MGMDKLVATLDELWEHFKADPECLYLTSMSRLELSEEILGDRIVCHGDLIPGTGATVTEVINQTTGSIVRVETIDPDLPGRLDYLETRIQIV